MSSTAVRGGTVVNSDGRRRADVLVEDHRIAAVSEPGALEAEAVIDVTGLFVLPGLVDPHVHVRDPGLTHKEDFRTATMAAVSGGITTVMVMPFDNPVVADLAALQHKRAIADGRIFADVALQAAVGPANCHLMADLLDAGAVSFELMLGVDAANGLAARDEADVSIVFEAAALAGAIVGVSCESFALVEARTARLKAQGRGDALAYGQSRAEAGEVIGVTIASALALETGVHAHIRQVSVPGSVDVIRSYRRRGADISFEVTPHNLLLTSDDHRQAPGRLKVIPPLRPADSVRELRARFDAGEVDMIGSDHAPHLVAEKAVDDDDVWQAPAGLPGLETLLGSMLAITGPDRLESIADMCAQQPAQRFRLAGKGRVAAGYDADLAIIDPDGVELSARALLYTKAGYRAFRPDQLRGAVRYTMLHGHIVAEDGVVRGSPAGRILSPERAGHARVD